VNIWFRSPAGGLRKEEQQVAWKRSANRGFRPLTPAAPRARTRSRRGAAFPPFSRLIFRRQEASSSAALRLSCPADREGRPTSSERSAPGEERVGGQQKRQGQEIEMSSGPFLLPYFTLSSLPDLVALARPLRLARPPGS
jgi:hypothetical protein